MYICSDGDNLMVQYVGVCFIGWIMQCAHTRRRQLTKWQIFEYLQIRGQLYEYYTCISHLWLTYKRDILDYKEEEHSMRSACIQHTPGYLCPRPTHLWPLWKGQRFPESLRSCPQTSTVGSSGYGWQWSRPSSPQIWAVHRCHRHGCAATYTRRRVHSIIVTTH